MIIYRNEIKAKKAIRYEEDVTINIKDIENNPDIIKVNKVHVVCEAKEVVDLSFEENDYGDEDIIQIEEDHFDLYPEILSTIITSIPLKIIGKDDPESLQGDHWEVISEDEYYKKKKEAVDPRFAKLLEMDFDDEEE